MHGKQHFVPIPFKFTEKKKLKLRPQKFDSMQALEKHTQSSRRYCNSVFFFFSFLCQSNVIKRRAGAFIVQHLSKTAQNKREHSAKWVLFLEECPTARSCLLCSLSIFPGQCPVLSIIVLLPLFERGSQSCPNAMPADGAEAVPKTAFAPGKGDNVAPRTCLQKIKCCTAQLP